MFKSEQWGWRTACGSILKKPLADQPASPPRLTRFRPDSHIHLCKGNATGNISSVRRIGVLNSTSACADSAAASSTNSQTLFGSSQTPVVGFASPLGENGRRADGLTTVQEVLAGRSGDNLVA
jgi:hypothetical protein